MPSAPKDPERVPRFRLEKVKGKNGVEVFVEKFSMETDHNSRVDEIVSNRHKKDFPKEYAAFKASIKPKPEPIKPPVSNTEGNQSEK